mmetsp:Transcript_21869/g.30527  ORF Transcript_21869/g.30527 Transcript_21869/m.30527 type:complete len:302 (-) Transcript_21869:123-1028(-)|eukprot:CAMPEP_0184505050 /NCGR_PEP_ID=MMETSP0113_2-20130426/52784_1 /TAXON_ID=91329 /ORGANISM="Norrisiella sphaerica, Strain BC52" /LENGTH=301 /DNA_ID=CAMNT_0026894719 /DNA_START=27 /DNA_END=932 /DNA_ORIENTATION=-
MDASVKQQIIDTTKRLLQDGFLDGHVAMRCRSDGDKFLMAKALPPGTKIKGKDIRMFHIKNGEPADDMDSAEASAERFVHAAIFAARPDIKCSIHTHAAALKTLSSSAMQLPNGQNHQHHAGQGQAIPQNGSQGVYPQPMWRAALQMQVEERKRIMSHQIIHQIEFYLGDTNLPFDSYLLNQMEKLAIKATPATPSSGSGEQEEKESAKTGRAWLPLDLIIKFKRMQIILSSLENNPDVRRDAVAVALKDSKVLELSKDAKCVRRRFPLPSDSSNIQHPNTISGQNGTPPPLIPVPSVALP